MCVCVCVCVADIARPLFHDGTRPGVEGTEPQGLDGFVALFFVSFIVIVGGTLSRGALFLSLSRACSLSLPPPPSLYPPPAVPASPFPSSRLSLSYDGCGDGMQRTLRRRDRQASGRRKRGER